MEQQAQRLLNRIREHFKTIHCKFRVGQRIKIYFKLDTSTTTSPWLVPTCSPPGHHDRGLFLVGDAIFSPIERLVSFEEEDDSR